MKVTTYTTKANAVRAFKRKGSPEGFIIIQNEAGEYQIVEDLGAKSVLDAVHNVESVVETKLVEVEKGFRNGLAGVRKDLEQIVKTIVEDTQDKIEAANANMAENKRVGKIQAAIDSMKIIPINGTLEQYNDHLLKVSNIDVNENFAEFKIQATEVKKQVIGQLNAAIEQLKARELERQELERLRQKEIDEKIEAARQEGIRSAQQAQSVPVQESFIHIPANSGTIVNGLDQSSSLPTTEQLATLREGIEDKRATAQQEAYNSMIALGCPPDYASWFLNAVLSGSIKTLNLLFKKKTVDMNNILL